MENLWDRIIFIYGKEKATCDGDPKNVAARLVRGVHPAVGRKRRRGYYIYIYIYNHIVPFGICTLAHCWIKEKEKTPNQQKCKVLQLNPQKLSFPLCFHKVTESFISGKTRWKQNWVMILRYMWNKKEKSGFWCVLSCRPQASTEASRPQFPIDFY